MRFYVQRDKNMKREMDVNKRAIVDSVKFIKKYMKENNIHMLRDYLNTQNGHRKIIVDHYVHGDIDKYFLVWLVKVGKLVLTDDDRACMTYIVHQYREIGDKLQEINGFMRKVGQML
jgi:predicted RNA-binding protein